MTTPPAPRAFVTGAARGIGRAVAERFLGAGWAVAMADVDAAGVHAAAAAHPRATAHALDVRDPAAWAAALAAACPDGRLDLLVNNAGVLAAGPFADQPPEAHRRQVEVNVVGVTNGCALALPYLRRAARPCVVNLCSASSLYGQPGLAVYGATKAAVRSLTEALDLEWRPLGVRVRDVVPLFVETDLIAPARGLGSLRRLGVRLTPADVAEAVWRAAREPAGRLRAPHRAVGWQTRALAAASAVAPDWARRLGAWAVAGDGRGG